MTEKEYRQRVLPLKRLMFATALKMGIPPDDAADAVQETQIRLWRCRDSIPPDPHELRLYCMAAFRNQCVSAIRHRRETVEIETAINLAADETDRTEFRDMISRVEQLIDTLPSGQATAIRLSAFSGLDNGEIARQTGQTENNVRQLLSRGRRRLRNLFESLH